MKPDTATDQPVPHAGHRWCRERVDMDTFGRDGPIFNGGGSRVRDTGRGIDLLRLSCNSTPDGYFAGSPSQFLLTQAANSWIFGTTEGRQPSEDKRVIRHSYRIDWPDRWMHRYMEARWPNPISALPRLEAGIAIQELAAEALCMFGFLFGFQSSYADTAIITVSMSDFERNSRMYLDADAICEFDEFGRPIEVFTKEGKP
ncbi:hypothetical protein [Maricaulis sp.]|uniref:hypothetical protein n=1 Tax=Maricaulis sp. TaxID=1486257 RepID=UPI003A90250E